MPKLLEYDSTLTLNKAFDIARTAEATTSQLADIRNTDKAINSLKHSKPEIPSFAKPQSQVFRRSGTMHDQTQRFLCPVFPSVANAISYTVGKGFAGERNPLKIGKGQGKGYSTKDNFQRNSNNVRSLENEMANDSFHTISFSYYYK